jgi:hypothetical protein
VALLIPAMRATWPIERCRCLIRVNIGLYSILIVIISFSTWNWNDPEQIAVRHCVSSLQKIVQIHGHVDVHIAMIQIIRMLKNKKISNFSTNTTFL